MTLLARQTILLALFTIVPCAGCIVDRPATYFYPTDLAPAARQAIFWPADTAGSEFRFIFEGGGEDLLSDFAALEELPWPSSFDARSRLGAQLDSVTVLLPHKADPDLHARASSLLAAIAQVYPDVSTHVVVTKLDLAGIGSRHALAAALERGKVAHDESRPTGLGQGLGMIVGLTWMMYETPNYIVVPLASKEGAVAVIGDWRSGDGRIDTRTMMISEAEKILPEELRQESARKLQASWGTVDGTGQTRISVTSSGSAFVAVLVPKDVPPERRKECEDLVKAIAQDRLAPIAIVQAETVWNWSECTSAEAVRNLIPPIPGWNFLVGPIRQTVVLPPRTPTKD